jgi:hypothetical protein
MRRRGKNSTGMAHRTPFSWVRQHHPGIGIILSYFFFFAAFFAGFFAAFFLAGTRFHLRSIQG